MEHEARAGRYTTTGTVAAARCRGVRALRTIRRLVVIGGTSFPSPSWVAPDEEKAADPAAAAAPDDENALVAGSADICTPQSKS